MSAKKTEITDAVVRGKKSFGEKSSSGKTVKQVPSGLAKQADKNRKKYAPSGKRKTNKQNKPKTQKEAVKLPLKPLKVSFLGGLNEVGKNMTLYEYDGDMFLVDCGLSFPDADMFGVDLVIPDFSYVEQNKDKIKGIVITHGHEDHIGGLPYLLKMINIPVYGTLLTLSLIHI